MTICNQAVLSLLTGVVVISSAHADGGTLQFTGQRHGYQISIFTSPTPLRTGSVDVSVLVQETATGKIRTDVPISVRAFPLHHPESAIGGSATHEAATNKLFQAIILDLPEPGKWRLQVTVQEAPAPIELEVEVAGALPSWVDLSLWIGWPALAVVLFAIHQWLVHRRLLAPKRP